MSDLAQYNHNKLTTDAPCIAPGAWVNHIEDGQSWGMVVASSGDQASVLWSRAPRTVPENFAAPPPAVPKSSKVWAQDDIDLVGRMYDAGMVSKSFIRERFGLEETYSGLDMTNEQLDELKRDHADITFHANGDVVVKREVEQLPSYVRPEDVRRKRSRY